VKQELGLIGRRDSVGHRHTEQGEQPRHFRELERSIIGNRESYLEPGAWWLRGSRAKAPKLEGGEFAGVRNRRIAQQFHLFERGCVVETGEVRMAGADVDA